MSAGNTYITDTLGARVLRLKKGATTLEEWAVDKALLATADGLAFLAMGCSTSIRSARARSYGFQSVSGTKGEVKVLKEGLTGGPVAVTVAGGMAYVVEGKLNLRNDPSKDPGPFRVIGVPYQARN